jgi:hypothetical protein
MQRKFEIEPFLDDSQQHLTRLETLVQDYKLNEFQVIFAFLDFNGETIPDLLEIAYSCSLFSGNVKRSVRARSGEPAQYRWSFRLKIFKPTTRSLERNSIRIMALTANPYCVPRTPQ